MMTRPNAEAVAILLIIYYGKWSVSGDILYFGKDKRQEGKGLDTCPSPTFGPRREGEA